MKTLCGVSGVSYSMFSFVFRVKVKFVLLLVFVLNYEPTVKTNFELIEKLVFENHYFH